ncbi:DUF397 domain-containing protein [Actinomadura sp. GTD37]|uniref:DUF397 domain-containing protein n=1 Tax=Actinomadura sp. GTD37 TaxID=1778030 RepID=UPI0035C1467D
MELSGKLWRKASKSHEEGDACVEITDSLDVVAMRDSRDPDGPKIAMSRHEFRQFTEVLKRH